MAHLSHSERPLAAASVFAPFDALSSWFRQQREKSRRERSLETLDALGDHLLDDIGLSRDDLREAARLDSRQGLRLLNERRARSASRPVRCC